MSWVCFVKKVLFVRVGKMNLNGNMLGIPVGIAMMLLGGAGDGRW